MPSSTEISATIGSASAPTCSQMRQTSFQRTLPGCRAAYTRAANVSPMNSTCTRMSRQMPYAAKPISSTAGRRGGSGSRSCASTAGSNCFSSAANAGLRLATSTLPSRGLAQQVDEQRGAGTVAVLDAGRVDDERASRRLRGRAPRRVPEAGQRRRVEAARQRQYATAVGGVVDRQGRHASADASADQSTSSRLLPATRTRSPSRTNGS